MLSVSVCLALCVLVFIPCQIDANSDLGTVVLSHVLFRHGSRMPLEFYPNDPYKDQSHWPFGLAQLTDEGKKEEYELGQWLRKRYNHLVSERYEASEVFVQSTDTDRTLMSAQCAMAGLYQRQGALFQPVPVHTMPPPVDCVLAATSTCSCPVYDAELKRATQLPEVKLINRRFEAMYIYASDHTGMDVNSFAAAIKVYDTLQLEEQYNKTLPEWTHLVYPEPIREASLWSLVLPSWTTLLQRLKAGPLLKEMVGHFQAKRAGRLEPDRRLWVYSIHDATQSALLNTLKAFDLHFPPYAACILLELRLIQQEYFVTLFYRNSTTQEPQLLAVQTCATVCPLDQFIALVQPVLPGDWDQECQLPPTSFTNTTWIAVGVVCLMTVILLAIFYLKRIRRSHFTTCRVPFKMFEWSKPTSLESSYSYTLPK